MPHKAVTVQARAQFPEAGWDIRDRRNASPQLERNVERFTQFLTIVGLTALLVGGVGVGNAVKSHLDRRRETIATLKALGASGRLVFAVYLTQVLMLAAVGGGIGMVLGAILPFLISWTFGAIIPLPIEPAVHPSELALALLYGLMTALAFALWPLGRAHDVPVGALFRDVVAPQPRWPRKIYIALTAAAVLALVVLAVVLAYDRRVAIVYVGVAAGVFITLRLVASLLMLAARHAPRAHVTVLRMAIANIHRPGALTPTIVLSLGLGIALLVTVIEIDGNLHRQLAAELPAKAPSFYFLDIPADQAERFDAFVRAQAPAAKLEEVPMLRGRIVSANGIAAENLKPKEGAAWVLQSDRGITYSGEIPSGSRLVEGKWWGPDYDGPPLLSFEKKIADGLGLKLGDPVTVNVLGRNITTRIANMRTVDWESLGINFVMVFSPHAFDGAPHTHLATLTFPDGGTPAQEGSIVRAVAETFPDGHCRAGEGRAGSDRRHRRQSGAGDPRRQRAHFAGGGPGAGRRTRRRPPPPGLRRGDPEDARCHPPPAARRLYHRIFAAGDRHRVVRRAQRLARGLADRGRPDALIVRLAAGARFGGRARCGCDHSRVRADRDL